MTDTPPERIEAMIARVERSYARDPAFVFEVEGSPLERLAYRHVRHLWFVALGRVTAVGGNGRPSDPRSIELYGAVCQHWRDDGTAPPAELLRRVGAEILPGATYKMLRKRFDAAQRREHRERFRDSVQSRAEAELLLQKVSQELDARAREIAQSKARAVNQCRAEAKKRSDKLDAREHELAKREALAEEIKPVWSLTADRNFLHALIENVDNPNPQISETLKAQARAALSAVPQAPPKRP